MQLVLKRLLEKGKIVAKKAYCDWSRFGQYAAALHESAIELVEIPKRAQTGKNSADIRLCVDAMDLAYSKDHIDTFVIVSGDSDFSPLVSKLKELGKHVIGLGMSASTSALLRDNCDEFIYYEDLTQAAAAAAAAAPAIKGDVAENKQRAFKYLFEGLQALRRENREVLGSSLVKDTVKRMHPSFNEIHLGFRNWGSLLVEAQKEGLLELTTDPKSGTFVIVRFGEEMKNSSSPDEKIMKSVVQTGAQVHTTKPSQIVATSAATSAATSVAENILRNSAGDSTNAPSGSRSHASIPQSKSSAPVAAELPEKVPADSKKSAPGSTEPRKAPARTVRRPVVRRVAPKKSS
ncbi:MAG: NYN domain-containing protein [Proteobacteria bacterium]|nr:NYN domain-containing protein [Pseudomonadota bacterium]